jgi:hypothetical protein
MVKRIKKSREETCKAILGQINWKTMHELTPSRIGYCAELLSDPNYDPGIVMYCHDVLIRWGWFVKAKLIDVPPWDNNLPWDKLAELAPWEKKEKKNGRKTSTKETKQDRLFP